MRRAGGRGEAGGSGRGGGPVRGGPLGRPWTPWLILAVVLLFTAVAARATWVAAVARDEARFENAIASTHDRIEARIQADTDLLVSAAAFVRVEHTDSLDDLRISLREYLRQAEFVRRYPGIQGIGFSERIPADRLSAREAELRSQDFPELAVWPVGKRGEYHAIVLLEPLDRRNLAAIGYDMHSEPVRRAAMDRARDTGEPAASGRVTLVQEISGERQAGFLIFVPVYRTGVIPPTVEERRRDLLGFVYAAFRADDFLEGIFGREREPRVAFDVYDGYRDRPESRLTHAGPPKEEITSPMMRDAVSLEVAGRPWTVRFVTLPAFERASRRPVAWLIAVTGVAAALLLFAVAKAQERARLAAEAVAEERRRAGLQLREITDSLPVLVALVDEGQRYRFANSTYGEWFRVDPRGLEGVHVRDLFSAEDYARLEPHIRAVLRGQRESFELELTLPTGRRHLRIEYIPHRERGQAAGYVALASDVTAETLAAKERVELLASEKRARGEAEALNRIGRVLAAELETDRLVQVIADEATRITGAEYGTFLRNTVDEHGDPALHLTASGGLRERFPGAAAPRKTALLAVTLDGAATLRIADATDDPRFRDWPVPVRSYLAVPVVSRSGEVLGGLFLSHSQPGVFGEEHARILGAIARQAAIALDNARLYEIARDADRRKDEFLAMLAHELRNPLSPIVTSLHLMRTKPADAATQARGRETIERQIQRMVRLVDDLLDVSRITRGKIQLRREYVDLRGALERAIEGTRPFIESRRHRLEVVLPAESVPVHADSVRMEQVFANLLNNAAKYTEPGGTIHVEGRVESGNAVVEVRDTGMGIPRETLPHIFDLFTQSERALDRAEGGLGIGLTLVRRLVELHGGRADAWSAGAGTGSRFTVVLPLSAATAGARPPSRAEPEPPVGSRRLRVLVVDDSVDIADTLAMFLRELGHEVRSADAGPAAIEVAREFFPDLVLLDLGLPGMSGYEVAQRLRRQPELSGVRIVAITGYAQESDRRRSREAGFDEHLAKPVAPERLRQLLNEVRVSSH